MEFSTTWALLLEENIEQMSKLMMLRIRALNHLTTLHLIQRSIFRWLVILLDWGLRLRVYHKLLFRRLLTVEQQKLDRWLTETTFETRIRQE